MKEYLSVLPAVFRTERAAKDTLPVKNASDQEICAINAKQLGLCGQLMRNGRICVEHSPCFFHKQ